MNVFYGVLGISVCCFFDLCFVLLIIMCGYVIMCQIKVLIEVKGYDVIYGDIDFIFVWLKCLYSEVQVVEIGCELVSYVNVWWVQEFSKSQFISVLELEYEIYFCCFLMLMICGVDIGSKKCYVGMIQEGDVQCMVFKGLEMVCIDWMLLVQQF